MKKYHTYIALFVVWLAYPTITLADEISSAAKSFQQLSSLVGDWKEQSNPTSEFTVRFQLTANDTTLMETWMYGKGTHSLTVYHLDGDNLLATHYCPQGNQPRMKMVPVDDSGDIRFEFMDATNLTDPNQSHQHALRFKMPDGDGTLKRGETYLSGDGPDVSTLLLIRK